MKIGGKKKVGILTTFYDLNTSYSLCSIVVDQLNVLKKYGYDAVLFVHDNFIDDNKVPEGVEIRKIVPRFQLVDYASQSKIADDFNEQVEKISHALLTNMKDIDICITHDIIFQGWFLPYNAAIRRVELPGLKWFHWIHSAPSPRPNVDYPHSLRFTLPKNSKLVYLNDTDVVRAAEMYGVWPKDVRVVYNMKDPRTFMDLHHLTTDLLNKYPILESDIVCVYAFSSTRMKDKGVDKIIRLMGKMKKLGKKVCFIACNAHANADKEKQTIKDMLDYAKKQGLNNEVIFTSLEGKDWEGGVPHKVISDLFRFSNVFIFPSISENCSLVLLEAALSKNLLVLNKSFAPMSDFFNEQALYFEFGSLIQSVKYDDEEKWYEDVAKIILSELKENKVINSFNIAKQKFNMDWIFKNQIEPLFYKHD